MRRNETVHPRFELPRAAFLMMATAFLLVGCGRSDAPSRHAAAPPPPLPSVSEKVEGSVPPPVVRTRIERVTSPLEGTADAPPPAEEQPRVAAPEPTPAPGAATAEPTAPEEAEVGKEAPEQEAKSVRIVESALASNVEKRVPEGVASSFGLDTERIWAWVKVDNPGEATTITMVWKKEGREIWRTGLKVGASPSWRTWSRKRVLPEDGGHWEVEVLSADGELLDTLRFEIRAARAPETAAKAG